MFINMIAHYCSFSLLKIKCLKKVLNSPHYYKLNITGNMNLTEIKKEIKKSANPQKAELLQRFFKTGPGQYGEGDIFLGIMVPVQRSIAKKFKELPLKNIKELLNSDKL